MKRFLAAATITAIVIGLGGTAAYADQPAVPGLPGTTSGPNSLLAKGGGLKDPGYNFGHCQSEFVVIPDYPPNSARIGNPAKFTAGQDFSASTTCAKDFEPF